MPDAASSSSPRSSPLAIWAFWTSLGGRRALGALKLGDVNGLQRATVRYWRRGSPSRLTVIVEPGAGGGEFIWITWSYP